MLFMFVSTIKHLTVESAARAITKTLFTTIVTKLLLIQLLSFVQQVNDKTAIFRKTAGTRDDRSAGARIQ
jgi:hypothetical protein